MNYPTVLSEDATLDLVLAGRSLARFGDGELKLATGRAIKAQTWNPALETALRQVAENTGVCLTGAPNIAAHAMPAEKAAYTRFCGEVRHVSVYGPGPFGSSFVSRPDCAPHIDRPDYWAKLRGLWADRDVILVRGSGKSFRPADLAAAASCHEILGPPIEAWDIADELYAALKSESRTVILCLGAVATVLAWRLAETGVHAVDLGGVGRFMRASRHATLP